MVDMYMFLPFAIALLAAIFIWFEKRIFGLLFAFASAIITVAWFFHHASDKLNISLGVSSPYHP